MRFKKFGIVFIAIAIAFTSTATSQKSTFVDWKILKVSKNDSNLLSKTWQSFLVCIKIKDRKKIIELSLDSVYCASLGYVLPGIPEKQLMPIGGFVDSIIVKFYNTGFMRVLTDSVFYLDKIMYTDETQIKNRIATGENLILYSVFFKNVVVSKYGGKYGDYYIFHFVKRQNRFYFFGLRLESAVSGPEWLE